MLDINAFYEIRKNFLPALVCLFDSERPKVSRRQILEDFFHMQFSHTLKALEFNFNFYLIFM